MSASAVPIERLRPVLLVVVALLAFLYSGIAGFAVLAAACAAGVAAEKLDVRRGYLAGALMVPALMHFYSLT